MLAITIEWGLIAGHVFQVVSSSVIDLHFMNSCLFLFCKWNI